MAPSLFQKGLPPDGVCRVVGFHWSCCIGVVVENLVEREGEVMSRIPMSLPGVGRTDTLAAGAKKALGEMRKEYGAKEGNRIFLAKADENGKGKTLRAKVNSTYRKGAKLSGNQS